MKVYETLAHSPTTGLNRVQLFTSCLIAFVCEHATAKDMWIHPIRNFPISDIILAHLLLLLPLILGFIGTVRINRLEQEGQISNTASQAVKQITSGIVLVTYVVLMPFTTAVFSR